MQDNAHVTVTTQNNNHKHLPFSQSISPLVRRLLRVCLHPVRSNEYAGAHGRRRCVCVHILHVHIAVVFLREKLTGMFACLRLRESELDRGARQRRPTTLSRSLRSRRRVTTAAATRQAIDTRATYSRGRNTRTDFMPFILS